jgi:GAF domain-containing protein
MVSTERLADVFVEVADTLVDEFDLIDFLHNLVDHAVTVSGAASAGLMLADQNDALQFMAASSSDARHLELFQLQHSEGPCLDCYRSHEPVSITDLAQEARRWPDFAPGAVEAGVRSVHAFPMRLRDRVIGALNVFGEEPLPLGPSDVKVVQAMADVATIAILQERAIASAELLTEQLQGALNSRIVIEQAKGVVSRDQGVGVDEAFEALRTHARSHGLRLVDLAHDVVAGTIAIVAPRS